MSKVKSYILLFVAVLLISSTTGCSQTASENTVSCKEYSLELPSRFTFEMEEGAFPGTSFFYENTLVGQIVFYEYEFDEDKLRSDNEERQSFFEKLISDAEISEYFDPNMISFSGDSKYGIFELWFGTKEDAEEPVSQYHYFKIAEDDLICDIWFDNTVLSNDEINSIMDSFAISH